MRDCSLVGVGCVNPFCARFVYRELQPVVVPVLWTVLSLTKSLQGSKSMIGKN